MNPTTETPQMPTEQIQKEIAKPEVKEIIKPKSNPSFIFYLLSFILGVALTLATLIILDVDLNKTLGLRADNSENTQVDNTKNGNKLPVNDNSDTEEEANEQVSEITYENRDILVEYWKDNAESAKTFVASLPKSSKITIEGTNTVRTTKIEYTDQTTGTTVLSLGFPHFGVNQEIASYEKVANTNLYRIILKSDPNTVQYAENITLTGQCDMVDEKIPAPCGNGGFKIEGITLLASVSNTKKDYSVADKIITSLKVK